MRKNFSVIIIFLLFLLFVFVSMNTYANAVSKDLSESFFRLHIIANSNSKEDQELKLKVRDSILDYMNKKDFKTKKEAQIYMEENINELYKIATDTIITNGYLYPINIEIGNFYFPTKYYGNISLPSGMYDGIKIKIGNAKGQNWWCSLFPPLCFTDVSSGIINNNSLNNLENNLSKEEFKIITDSNTKNNIKFKFKIVELLNKNH